MFQNYRDFTSLNWPNLHSCYCIPPPQILGNFVHVNPAFCYPNPVKAKILFNPKFLPRIECDQLVPNPIEKPKVFVNPAFSPDITLAGSSRLDDEKHELQTRSRCDQIANKFETEKLVKYFPRKNDRWKAHRVGSQLKNEKYSWKIGRSKHNKLVQVFKNKKVVNCNPLRQKSLKIKVPEAKKSHRYFANETKCCDDSHEADTSETEEYAEKLSFLESRKPVGYLPSFISLWPLTYELYRIK